MQALILSAGEGTRLRPFTNDMPKVMVPIQGKPQLEHLILLCKKYDITDIFINLYYKPEPVIRYFSDGKKFGVRITYTREDLPSSYRGPMLLGSAGALHNMKDFVKDELIVLYGDVYSQLNLQGLMQFHKDKHSIFTIVTQQAKHPQDSDLVELDSTGRVVKWIAKPHTKTSGMNNAGTYILHKDVLRFLPKEVPSDFGHDFIPILLKKNIPVFAYCTNDFMMDMGTQNRYNELSAKVTQGKS